MFSAPGVYCTATTQFLTWSPTQKYHISINHNIWRFTVPIQIPTAVSLSQFISVGGCTGPRSSRIEIMIEVYIFQRSPHPSCLMSYYPHNGSTLPHTMFALWYTHHICTTHTRQLGDQCLLTQYTRQSLTRIRFGILVQSIMWSCHGKRRGLSLSLLPILRYVGTYILLIHITSHFTWQCKWDRLSVSINAYSG
jgi:hypothetical protein